MSKIRLHLLSLPHTSTTEEYIACAYSAKCKRFADMMMTLGYDVYLYGGPENEANVTEHIVIASEEEQERWFGEFDHHKNFFPITWGPNDEHWVESNNNAIREIGKRIQPKDLILITAGRCQQQISNAFPNHMSLEWTIGYTGVYAPYKVFESYSHMHNVYGLQGSDDGKFFDAVIPNYFVPSDFTFNAHPEDYYVWMGRFITRKGPEIAVEVTRRLGAKLIMAGQGVLERTQGPDGTTLKGDGISVTGDHIEHIGHVNVEQRAKLLSGAKATFMATTYLEPFGGVSIESLMSGTPVIATDFGCFAENIVHGLAGYRFRTIGEATQFASDEYLDKLDRHRIRDYAVENFSVDRVKYLYDDYFKQLLTLWEDGFYTTQGTSADRYAKFL